MSSNLLDKKLEYWEHQLLDLGKRNKMIHYRETKRTTLGLVGPSFDELFTRLALNEETLTFQRPVDRETDVRVFSILSLLENLSAPLPVSIGDIQTEGSILERQRTLKNLRAKARLALEEQGTNILYLSFGFIEWRDGKGSSAQWIKSPLILVPAVLSLESLRSPYTLKKHEDDIIVNPTLQYYLKSEYGIDLPGFDSDRDTLEGYLKSLEPIADQKGWRILREVSLGLLSFLKITMYNDLLKNEERIKKNPVIRAMAGDYAQANEIPEHLHTFALDSVRPQDCYQVMSADSSQQDAITYSQNNVSFVMQGPPGTGKSQTITNIIAEALAQGKKVLFVSEKMAALQVVYRRLQEAHLGEFCLPLHSYKANKREILDEIGANLKLKQTRVKDTALASLEELLTIRRSLNQYAAELHALNPKLNMSCYEVYSKLEAVMDAPAVSFAMNDPLEISQEDLYAYLHVLREYALALEGVEYQIENSPWEKLLHKKVDYSFAGKMQDALSTMHTGLKSLMENLNTLCGRDLSDTLRFCDAAVLADGVSKAAGMPPVPAAWLENFDFSDAAFHAAQAQKECREISSLKEKIEEVFHPSVYSFDCVRWRKQLTRAAEEMTRIPGVKAQAADTCIRGAASLLENLSALRDQWIIIRESFAEMNFLLGTRFPANPHSQQLIIELLTLLRGNAILPQNWFGGDLARLQALVREAQGVSAELKACREKLLEEWEPEILSLDYAPILIRYKTDYTSLFRGLNSQYRADRRQIQALSREIIRKLPDEKVIGLLNELKDYHGKIAWFEGKHGELTNALSTYYTGASTDWERVLSAMDIAGKLLQLPGNGIPSRFISWMADDHSHQIEKLNALLSSSVTAFAVARELALKSSLFLDFDEADFKIDEAAAATDLYILKLEALNARKAEIVPCLKDPEEKLERIDDAIETLNTLKSANDHLLKRETLHKQQFDFLYRGVDTDWQVILELLQAVEPMCSHDSYGVFAAVLKSSASQKQQLSALAARIAAHHHAAEGSRTWLQEQFAGDMHLELQPLQTLMETVSAYLDKIDLLGKWFEYQEARDACVKAGLSDFVDEIEQKALMQQDIEKMFLRGFYHKWLGAVCDRSESVRRFKRSTQDERIKKFMELDDLQLRIAQMRIREKLIEDLPTENHMLKATDEVAILQKELGKRRNIMPLRRLFRQIPNLLMKLKPCLMMSPLSVSYFLETEAYHFDLVIFDEASQIFPEDAIGAIFRGSQVIIAGDSKQLPPTNFFASTTSNADGEYDRRDEDDFSEVVSDSILEESAAFLPNRTLLWHYRSQHEGLIAFSNREIYDNSLITFPNRSKNVPDMGVEYIYLADGCYDRGGKKCNIRETQECVRLVQAHIEKYPDRSLGIIAFSENQQAAIENAIIDFRERSPQYEWFFDESRDEPFFVKNLENVQGDERDTIIFSLGYGKDRNGKMYMNFGPLGHEGGERRLNVAITRAKRNIKLVGSILPSDIDLNRAQSEGARMLRAYIEYARRGTDVLKPVDGEREAFALQDDFCETIALFLEKHGYTVDRHVGCSDYTIDLAVVDPRAPGEYIAGIECDGLSYVQAKTARDRDHLRRSVLEKMGWNLYRVWSTQWIRYPKTEGEALLQYLHGLGSDDEDENAPDEEKGGSDMMLETIAAEIDGSQTAQSTDNPYGFDYYHEMQPGRGEPLEVQDDPERIGRAILDIVTLEQPLHRELLYRRMGAMFTAGRATEAVRDAVDQAIDQNLSGRVLVDADGFIRCLPLTAAVVRIPREGDTPRPMEYIHTEEAAAAMLRILERSFGITEEDLATECARVFGFERKGPRIRAKTEAAIAYLMENRQIRILDGKVQLTGE